MRMNQNILLQGPWYCLEQCGLLLKAAVTLFEAEQYPTAAALALFAHEELGKYRILIDLWHRGASEKGTEFSVAEIRDGYGNHVEKQRRGLLSVMLRNFFIPATSLTKL